jgi:hypothetical protein
LERQIELARTIATFILGLEAYKLLPRNTDLKDVYMIVLFRARSAALNDSRLVSQLNASRVMYVSESRWDGAPAVRLAVSTWRVDVARDSARAISELEEATSKQVLF